MGSQTPKGEGGGLTRRQTLGRIAFGFGAAAVFVLPFLLLGGVRKRASSPLPGTGSIFEPRQDARLQEWQRSNQG